jgi:hypothetical protein
VTADEDQASTSPAPPEQARLREPRLPSALPAGPIRVAWESLTARQRAIVGWRLAIDSERRSIEWIAARLEISRSLVLHEEYLALAVLLRAGCPPRQALPGKPEIRRPLVRALLLSPLGRPRLSSSFVVLARWRALERSTQRQIVPVLAEDKPAHLRAAALWRVLGNSVRLQVLTVFLQATRIHPDNRLAPCSVADRLQQHPRRLVRHHITALAAAGLLDSFPRSLWDPPNEPLVYRLHPDIPNLLAAIAPDLVKSSRDRRQVSAHR